MKAPPLARPTRRLPCCASLRVMRAKQRCDYAAQQRILGSSELLRPTLNPLRQVFAFEPLRLPLPVGVSGVVVFENLVFIQGKRQDLKIANSLTPKTCPRGQDVGSGMF